jgi:hypothetical protein
VDDALFVIPEALDDLGVQGTPVEFESLVGLSDNEARIEVGVYCHDGQSAS